MAYDTEDLFKRGKEAITKHRLIFIADVFHFLGIASSTFYSHFPSDSSEYKEFDEMLLKNRVDLKIGMRKKWWESDNPTLQVGFYKIISTEDERMRLSVNYNKNENKDEIEHNVTLDFSQINDEMLDALERAIIKKSEDNTPDNS